MVETYMENESATENKNFLLAKSILKKRHIAKESFCMDCSDADETIYHTMFECSYA
jgi:hypothetical protein